MADLQHVTEEHYDVFKRLEEGLCAIRTCSGRLLFKSLNTHSATVPKWVNDWNIKNGKEPYTEPIEVTIYDYQCLKCGHEVKSTELISSALTN